jgi:16S rRNA (uracil1498-N3)-methyltransferase
LRVPFVDLKPGACCLAGPLARYVARVHRLGPGDELLLFDPERGLEAGAVISAVGKSEVRFQLQAVRSSGYRPYPLSLLLALTKGTKPDATVREATALGVRRLVFVEAERSVARPELTRMRERHQRWKRVAIEAARQSGRGDLPSIEGPFALDAALQTVGRGCRIILQPGASPLLSQLESQLETWGGLALLVGPEGGFEGSERDQALGAGFVGASLGRTVLRSELAAVAALAVCAAFADRAGMIYEGDEQ